jgi:hypothetical protein
MAFFNGLPNVDIFKKIFCIAASSCKPPEPKKKLTLIQPPYILEKIKTAAFVKPSSGKIYEILTQEKCTAK